MLKIICEGRTDRNNLKNLLAFIEIEASDDDFIVMGNKSNLLNPNYIGYKNLNNEIANKIVAKLLFIIDSDDENSDALSGGYQNTTEKIIDLQEKLEVKEMSDYYIACDPETQKGYFESLLLSTVEEDIKRCYIDFLKCSNLESKDNQKTIMEELHRLTKLDKPYDFTHPHFDELKTKLQNLFN